MNAWQRLGIVFSVSAIGLGLVLLLVSALPALPR